MRCIVTTCDENSHFLRGFSELFNRFWGSDQEVEVLGFSPPDVEFPPNFRFHSLGRQEDFIEGVWTDPLASFFESFGDDYFVHLLEDQYLLRRVDHERLREAESLLVEHDLDKVFLYSSPNTDQVSYMSKSGWNLMTQRAYRTSLSPSLWRKDYFCRFLTPGIGPWRMDNHPKSWSEDGSKIIFPSKGAIYPFADVCRRGCNVDPFFVRANPGESFGKGDWQVITEEFSIVVRRLYG